MREEHLATMAALREGLNRLLKTQGLDVVDSPNHEPSRRRVAP